MWHRKEFLLTLLSFLIAIACVEERKVFFFELRKKDGKIQMKRDARQLTEIHKMPVYKVRLSKKQPFLLVSFGDETDTHVNLFNINSNEVITSIDTKQLKHKGMGHGKELDYYAAVAWTSEVKINKITFEKGALKGVRTQCINYGVVRKINKFSSS